VIAPAAETVETAIEQLKNPAHRAQHQAIFDAQEKEVRSAIPGQSEEFYDGYELGVEAARVLVSQMPQAVMNKLSI
jgi:hypothetical protein